MHCSSPPLFFSFQLFSPPLLFCSLLFRLSHPSVSYYLKRDVLSPLRTLLSYAFDSQFKQQSVSAAYQLAEELRGLAQGAKQQQLLLPAMHIVVTPDIRYASRSGKRRANSRSCMQ